MSAPRHRRAHQARAQSINRAIDALAAMGPPDELWSLQASTDPAGFLRAVQAHIQALRDQLRAASPSTARDVPAPPPEVPTQEIHP